MSPPANNKLIGRWRIVGADIWDRDYLDLCGAAMITIADRGRGEIAFGALQARLDIEYTWASVGFTWGGFDEMGQVSGDGSAELLDDGSIEIEFAYHNSSKPNGTLVQQPVRSPTVAAILADELTFFPADDQHEPGGRSSSRSWRQNRRPQALSIYLFAPSAVGSVGRCVQAETVTSVGRSWFCGLRS
jgi:hypothetical protein